MTRIAADLASRPPGGRNAAAYAAGLKAGSLLGAARATPGAEQAAAAWSDEAAEDALLDAAERNGYTGKDGQAEARRAIRSGLRNGLASPRALPDFTTPRPAPARQQRQHQPAASGPARPQPGRAAAGPAQRTRRWQEAVPDGVRRQVQGAGQAAAGLCRTAIAARQQAVERLARPGTRGPAAGVERTRAQAGAAIAAQREPPAGPAPGPGESRRMRANRAAVAANAAYRAGNLDQARQFTDQAAALDPSRAGLWQQHREQIAARRLILDARSWRTPGATTSWHENFSARPASSTPACPPSGTAACPPRRRPAMPATRPRRDLAAPRPPATQQPGKPAASTASPPPPAKRRPGRRGRQHQPATSHAARPRTPHRRQTAPRHPRSGTPPRRRANREHTPEPPRKTRRPAPNRLTATHRHAGQRPGPAPPGRPARRARRPAARRSRASDPPGHSSRPAPRRRGDPAARILTVPRRRRTGATRSSARPVSGGSPVRAGRTIPSCTGQPRRPAPTPG